MCAVAEWLQHLTAVMKIAGSSPVRPSTGNPLCSPRSKLVHFKGWLKVGKERIGHAVHMLEFKTRWTLTFTAHASAVAPLALHLPYGKHHENTPI